MWKEKHKTDMLHLDFQKIQDLLSMLRRDSLKYMEFDREDAWMVFSLAGLLSCGARAETNVFIQKIEIIWNSLPKRTMEH